jgi:predicted hotdog family 3-hydroxylacyl-ACP dehydratase
MMMTDAETLDHAAIERLIPHKGAMCLLERVLEIDAATILCAAHSHRDRTNPLRVGASLPMVAGVEYAAQAAALHAALRPAPGEAAGAPKSGVLAVLSDVTWSRERLDEVGAPLLVRVEQVSAMRGGFQYRFSLSHDDETVLSGAFIVARDAPDAATN